jgi:hypothetical protein
MKNQKAEFGDKETQRRFDAALRGARIAGPKPNETLTPSYIKAQRKKRKKAKSGRASSASE